MSTAKRLMTYSLNGKTLIDPFIVDSAHHGGTLGQLAGQGFLERGEYLYDQEGILIVKNNTYQLTEKGISWMKQSKAPVQYQGEWPPTNR